MGASVFMCGKAFSQIPSYVPSNGLVGWWPFNGNANDESGNGNNGTEIGNVLLTNDRFGNSNQGYSFPGNSNSYINVNNSISLQIKKNLSISVWIYMENGFINPRIISFGNGSNSGYGMSVAGTANTSRILDALFTNDGGSGTGFCCGNGGTGINVPALSWQHIVFTVDSTGVSKLFQNSTLIAEALGTLVNNPVYTTNMNIGRLTNSSYDAWGGKIDDIGIWNRALTQQEITNLYNGCSASTITTQPTNQTVNPTTSAQFIVNATSGTSFQWQTDLGLGFQNLSNAGQYSGANNDTLVVSNASISNNNQQFRCIVNPESCADTSDIAVLTVSTVGMNELSVQGNVSLYPNPTQSSFEIQTNLVFSKIEIRDMQGRIVKTVNAGKTITIASLQKGTYLVQLLDEKSKVLAVQQIIKE